MVGWSTLTSTSWSMFARRLRWPGSTTRTVFIGPTPAGRSWQGLDLDAEHRAQVADDPRPRVAAVGGAVDLPAGGAEVDPAVVERVDRHRVAQHVDVAVL